MQSSCHLVILSAYLRPARDLLQGPVSLAESLLDPHPVPAGQRGEVPQRDVVVLRLVGEDVQGHLRPLLLDVLDEESDLHGSPGQTVTP